MNRLVNCVSQGSKKRITTKKMEAALKKIVAFLAEVNILKKTPRLGWRLTGPPIERDSVAAHIAGVAQIAYMLAKMAPKLDGIKPDPLKCVILAVFHDNPETRISDRDKVSTHYLKTKKAFREAIKEQISALPEEIGEEIRQMVIEANFRNTPEAIVVRDADILEASLQAKVFNEEGYKILPELLKKYLDPKRVQTQAAKRLMEILRNGKISFEWLKKLVL